MDEPEEWTVAGFLDHFKDVHRRMGDRSFAFILGAGASRSSQIPTGGELVDLWLKELQCRLDKNHETQPLESWATAKNLGINKFDYKDASSFYPEVFERRFRDDPEEGFAYLEEVMEGKEPSLGYSILSQILSDTRHQVVITTNFDNLVADAMGMYSRKHPLVAAHESLTEFVRAKLRRPLVAKIHRDLFFAPKNDTSGVSKLDDSWELALTRLFEHYTPIVIGYGGNDGSLMGLLEKLEPNTFKGGIYWCYRENDPLPPNGRIKAILQRHRGKFIPIVGFDEFMLQIGDKLDYPLLADNIEKRGKETAQRYRDQVEKIQIRLNKNDHNDSVRKALASTVDRQHDWWSWQLKVNEAKSVNEKEEIYIEGINNCPKSNGLVGNFANFMKDVRKNYDKAEQLYQQAIELDPENATTTGNFAIFMKDIRKDYDKAEQLYLRAIELDPNDASNISNFANFMNGVRKNYDKAEQLYRQAIELDPEDLSATFGYALFNDYNRKDYDKAEQLYRQAIKIDPEDADITGAFAIFMAFIRKNISEAKQLFQVALEIDDKHINNIVNYSSFLLNCNLLKESDEYAKRALTLNSNNIDQTAAEAILYRGLIACINKHEDTNALGRLKTIFNVGYQRDIWNFDQIFESIKNKLKPDTYKLYISIANAILFEDKVKNLESFPRWKETKPIQLDTTWND